MKTKGAIIAAMAAGLFGAGAPLVASAADSAKVHCQGVNSCKGKGACHGASNGCAGQNGCKGKGWALDVWYLLTFNGMVGEGRAFLVDLEERAVVRERDFQFRAG